MRLGLFLAGLLLGLLLAPASGRETIRRLRDRLALTIDAVLRVGVPSAAK
jgi:hypothetical protein